MALFFSSYVSYFFQVHFRCIFQVHFLGAFFRCIFRCIYIKFRIFLNCMIPAKAISRGQNSTFFNLLKQIKNGKKWFIFLQFCCYLAFFTFPFSIISGMRYSSYCCRSPPPLAPPPPFLPSPPDAVKPCLIHLIGGGGERGEGGREGREGERGGGNITYTVKIFTLINAGGGV